MDAPEIPWLAYGGVAVIVEIVALAVAGQVEDVHAALVVVNGVATGAALIALFCMVRAVVELIRSIRRGGWS